MSPGEPTPAKSETQLEVAGPSRIKERPSTSYGEPSTSFSDSYLNDLTQSSNKRKRKLSGDSEDSADDCKSNRKVANIHATDPNDIDIDGGTEEKKPEDEIDVNGQRVFLLDLCDELLLEIFKDLNTFSLLSLGSLNSRLKFLIRDKRLWKHADFTCKKLTASGLATCMHLLNKDTKTLKVRGVSSRLHAPQYTFTVNNFTILNETCPQLEELVILNDDFDFTNMSVVRFPRTLKVLELNNCHSNGSSVRRQHFFHRINDLLVDLVSLSLINCSWFDPHDLIVFSKLPNLKTLRLRGCASMKECVPYASMAARFGFHKLKFLDLSLTPVSDSDVGCFNFTRTLKELYLECPVHLRNQRRNSSLPQPPEVRSNEPNAEIERLQQQDPLEIPLEQDDEDEANLPAPIIPIEEMPDPPNLATIQNNYPPPFNVNPNLNHAVMRHNIRYDVRNENVNGRNVFHFVLPSANRSGNPDHGPRDVAPRHHYIIVAGLATDNNEDNSNNNNNNDNANNNNNNNNNNNRAPHIYNEHFLLNQLPPSGESPEGVIYRHLRSHPPVTLVSDRGISCFGQSPVHNQGVVWIRAERREQDTLIERLIVRYYKLVSDVSLRHLALCAPKLKYLDITGTSCTVAGIRVFKTNKPNCEVITDKDMSENLI